MADQDRELRRIAAEAYRATAARLHMEAAVRTAQAEAFEDAASSIEKGEADVDTLRLVPPPKPTEEEQAHEAWRTRRLRVLEAVVAASRQPAANPEEAGLDRIAEEAGFDPQDIDDCVEDLRDLERAGLVERRQIVLPGPRPLRVIIPTPEGFVEAGHAAPHLSADDAPEHDTILRRAIAPKPVEA